MDIDSYLIKDAKMDTGGADSAKITQSASFGAWSFLPKTKSILCVTPEFHIYQTRNKPNRWIRFWQRVLLGWTWRDA